MFKVCCNYFNVLCWYYWHARNAIIRRCSTAWTWLSNPVRRWRWWVRVAPGRAPLSACSYGFTTRKRDKYKKSFRQKLTSVSLLFFCFYSLADLPGLGSAAQLERALAPRSNRDRVSGADTFRSVDRRQYPIRTGRHNERRARRRRHTGERAQFYQKTAERKVVF